MELLSDIMFLFYNHSVCKIMTTRIRIIKFSETSQVGIHDTYEIKELNSDLIKTGVSVGLLIFLSQ